jgi:hypothetical protein
VAGHCESYPRSVSAVEGTESRADPGSAWVGLFGHAMFLSEVRFIAYHKR